MASLTMVGLLLIELPSHTAAIADGGAFSWNGNDYSSADSLFGTLAGLETLSEGRGNEIPAAEIDFFPPDTAALANLTRPGDQQSRLRFWLSEYDRDTGQIVGNPDLLYDGQVDRTTLAVGKQRILSMSVVSRAERLFEINIGNSLNPGFHKSVWAGELGHDNATGLKTSVAWGVEGQIRGSRGGGGGGNGSNPGRNFQPRNFNEY